MRRKILLSRIRVRAGGKKPTRITILNKGGVFGGKFRTLYPLKKGKWGVTYSKYSYDGVLCGSDRSNYRGLRVWRIYSVGYVDNLKKYPPAYSQGRFCAPISPVIEKSERESTNAPKNKKLSNLFVAHCYVRQVFNSTQCVTLKKACFGCSTGRLNIYAKHWMFSLSMIYPDEWRPDERWWAPLQYQGISPIFGIPKKWVGS